MILPCNHKAAAKEGQGNMLAYVHDACQYSSGVCSLQPGVGALHYTERVVSPYPESSLESL